MGALGSMAMAFIYQYMSFSIYNCCVDHDFGLTCRCCEDRELLRFCLLLMSVPLVSNALCSFASRSSSR